MRKYGHDFTCPDSIFLLRRGQKLRRISWMLNGVLLVGFMTVSYLGGKKLERDVDRKIADETD